MIRNQNLLIQLFVQAMRRCALIFVLLISVLLVGCGPSRQSTEADAAVKKDLDFFRAFLYEGTDPNNLMAARRISKTPVDIRILEEHCLKLSVTRDAQKSHLASWKLEELDNILREMESFKALALASGYQREYSGFLREAKAVLIESVGTTFFDLK